MTLQSFIKAGNSSHRSFCWKTSPYNFRGPKQLGSWSIWHTPLTLLSQSNFNQEGICRAVFSLPAQSRTDFKLWWGCSVPCLGEFWRSPGLDIIPPLWASIPFFAYCDFSPYIQGDWSLLQAVTLDSCPTFVCPFCASKQLFSIGKPHVPGTPWPVRSVLQLTAVGRGSEMTLGLYFHTSLKPQGSPGLGT